MNSSRHEVIKFGEAITREEFKSGNLAVNTPTQLKAYFEYIKSRFDSGEQYPYNLEELVGVAYSKKSDAVEALEKSFSQPIDFTIIRQSPQKSIGRPVQSFWLTPLTFEYMVARQCKPVFEIYHQIFHAAMTIQQFTSPEDLMVGQAKLMLQVCESLAGLQKKVLKLESRVDEALPREGYMTILAFCAKHKVLMTTGERLEFGKLVSKYCREHDIFVDKVPDKRYGSVNAYPEDVLLECVEQLC